MQSRRILIITIVVAVAVAIYFLYDPADTSNPFPKCPFLWLTGWKCPGCGLQRATHALLHLDIGKALHYNMLFVTAIPIVLFYFIVEIAQKSHPRLYAIANSGVAIGTLIVTVLLWWILRNVYGL